MKHHILLLLICSIYGIAFSQKKELFQHEDTLRGSIGAGRQKWNVLKYDITVKPDFETKTIVGSTIIQYADSGNKLLQIDLQEPMVIDSIIQDYHSLIFNKEKNVYWVNTKSNQENNNHQIAQKELTIYFHGKPRVAVNPPWDGGWIWKKDKSGNPWISVACQGLGASCWYPCKDVQSDEPDNGAALRIIVPDSLTGIGNGRLLSSIALPSGFTQYNWEVRNPINNYNIVPYIGKYTNFSETYKGENGKLDMNYWVLNHNLEKAKNQFKDAVRMMEAFENWFGPYPFYEDGYKLVEAPHLGMEHQSAIAYGNQYKNGYLGRDLSGSGWGLKWDFIIVHESGHEWFANNITTNDIADMWVHEGFTNYSETLFTEYFYGKKAAEDYISGIRKDIQNDKPIIGYYGVNNEGSGDMYNKGGNMIHTIRQIIGDDKKFRTILRGLNSNFYHKTVNSQDIEQYINEAAGIDFSSIFNQYLRTTKIPTVEYYLTKKKLYYRWKDAIDNLYLPIEVNTDEKKSIKIIPSNEWKVLKNGKRRSSNRFSVNRNYYVLTQQIFDKKK
jgi:aminopeptidase N